MRKKLAILMVFVLSMLALAACGGAPAEEPEVAKVKTGMAVVTTADKSVSAGAEDGLAQAYSNIIAVTVDESGVITNCVIDAAQTNINFSKEGKIVTPLDSEFVGKLELGTDYGMAKASSIGKEWNEQATAFADYVIGKTVDEVKGIAVDAEGRPTGEDLTASVTIHVTPYINAIEQAVANATDKGASADDKLGIGVLTTVAKSTDATATDPGLAQAYSNYAIVTFNADGVITSCIIDASQTNINFDATGTITTDLAGPFPTKNELGADYGMVKASSIGKEWNEQAAAFADYVVGKTVEEVKGIALTDEGLAADTDLASSVTVHIGPFMTVVEKAYNAAK